MPAGILQLLISGAQDKILVENPQFNFFKQVYMHHSNFSIFNYEIPITSQYDFGRTVQVEIPKNGDLLRGIQLKVELPSLSVSYNNPANVEIENIKKTYSYKSINTEIYAYNLYNLDLFKSIMEYELGNASVYSNYPVYLFNKSGNTNTETYNVVMPKIDLNQFIVPSDNQYYFEINPNELLFTNSNVIFNYPTIETPIIDDDYAIFYNKVLSYANRNNKLTATFNIVQNLLQQNDTTTLLTSNNIRNIFIKNIKDTLFTSQEIASIDGLTEYINSIRFIRPINLYNASTVSTIINGGDPDLINLPEYYQTYFKTTDMVEIIIQASIINTALNSLNSRILYVLTNDTSLPNKITYNGILYGLYNILKIDFINISVLNSSYNNIQITSYLLFNYFDILKEAVSLTVKITPISNNYTLELNNFSQLIPVLNVESLLNGTYKITINLFQYDPTIILINRYMYFYYNITIDNSINLPICILKITNYYIIENVIYLIGIPLTFTTNNFTNNLLYLTDNQYILQTNNQNSNDYDIKKITTANIASDSINIYNNYISSTNNTNFYLDGTITTENSQKTTYISNFTKYIINNLNDDYAILYNIAFSIFKQPIQFVNTYSYASNLNYKVTTVYDGVGGITLSGIGQSTFTNQDTAGNSVMVKFLTAQLNTNFANLIITNNYYLSIINDAISTYNGNYQANWNSINTTIQNSSYMMVLNKTINYLENTSRYIQLNIDSNIHLTSNYSNVDIFNGNYLVTTLKLNSDNVSNINGIYYLNLFLNTYDNSNISNIFLIKNNYTIKNNNNGIPEGNIGNIFGITYYDTNYFTDLSTYLTQTTVLNPTSSLHANYILEDYILSLYDYIQTTINIYYDYEYLLNYPLNPPVLNPYATFPNSTTPLPPLLVTILDNNLLFKYISIGFHNILNLVDARIKTNISQLPVDVTTYINFMSDYEYLTDGIKLTYYFYNNIVNDFYNENMINGYYFYNSFVYNIPQPDTEYFSNFIARILNGQYDPFTNTFPGVLFFIYMFYIYGNQINYPYNNNILNAYSIRSSNFNYNTVNTLINNLNALPFREASATVSYLSYTTPDIFAFNTYQYKMNPHLYYSYLNLGYIENQISAQIYGNINLEIKNYTDFTYSDIDNVIVNVLGFYSGVADLTTISGGSIGQIKFNSTSLYYGNVITYSSTTDNILQYNQNTLNTQLNDLVTYNSYRIPSTNVNQYLIDTCNIYTQDVKRLIMYFNDNIDNITSLRFLLENDTTITGQQLYNNLYIPNYTGYTKAGINDYTLQYFIPDTMYNSVNLYRSSYEYNNLLTSFDTDVQNYFNYLTSINNTILIGSSLKNTSDILALTYTSADIYKLVNTRNIYGKIVIDPEQLIKIQTYLSNSQNIFKNEYKLYTNNLQLLNLNDDIELNTINNRIKSINIKSGSYEPTLSSMDQFTAYTRQLFNYNIDSKQDYIFDITPSLTNQFSVSPNISNIYMYNLPLLDTNIYENFSKTYEYQLRRIQSYFFSDVEGTNDSDLDYLKPFYALENTDIRFYNPVFIGQVNKYYNYNIPTDAVANISSLQKLDNNFNVYNYNIDRLTSNAIFYTEVLKILDVTMSISTGGFIVNRNPLSNVNISYITDFLGNNIVYSNYIRNSDTGSEQFSYKDPFSLTSFGELTFFSNGNTDPLNIPIINRYAYYDSNYNLSSLNSQTENINPIMFRYIIMYLLFDLYLLDGKMRANFNDISSINTNYFDAGTYDTLYRTLVSEYFYLLLRGKQVSEESEIVSISYKNIFNLISLPSNNQTYDSYKQNTGYDKLVQYYIYSSYDTNYYDLFNVHQTYKIPSIIKNHYYSKNFAIIYSIKDAFNDQNFQHLIDLTNYNNKYYQFCNVNNTDSSVVNYSQQTKYLANMNISDSFSFFGNIVVTNDDYNNLSNSILMDPNVFTSVFYIDSAAGNIKIDMNDIRDIKKNILLYYYNQIKNSNEITNTFMLDTNNNNIQVTSINNLSYNGNLISEIDINLQDKTFAIQKYYQGDTNFSPLNISSLVGWFDSSDSSNIYQTNGGSANVRFNGDPVGKWNNKAINNYGYQLYQNSLGLRPSWNSSGGIYFNGSKYLKTSIKLNTTSTVFIVTDTATTGGYYTYFDNGNVYQPSVIQGPTLWTDGPFGNYLYDDYSFNYENYIGINGTGRNILSFERVDGEYINGFFNGYQTLNELQGTTYGLTGNVTMSILPGYLDIANNIVESIVGNIFEILIFDNVLSQDNKNDINLYLATKWNFKTKINNEDYVQYYYFPFDYLPKLYTYNVANGNINISHTQYFDSTYSNIYDTVYLELRNFYSDITSNINNLNIVPIINYLYFSDVLNDISTLVFNTVFNYDISINQNDFSIVNGNIYIDPVLLNNYNHYISAVNNYINYFTIKDSFEFVLNPLKYDTNYINYTLMNAEANFGNNANIYYQKLPKLLEKTSVIPLNTSDRLYSFPDLVNLFFNVSVNGYLYYDKLSLTNPILNNTPLPTIPNYVNYQIETYNYAIYAGGGDSNVLILNSVIDINNKKDNLYDEKILIYNNTLAKIQQTNNEIKNYYYVNDLVYQINNRPANAVVSWIEKLGIYISNYFELYIGGEIIERVEDNAINIMHELMLPPEMRRAGAKMIGQDLKLIVKQTQLGTYTLFLDIPFYFNRYKKIHGLSIPLIALLYSKLHLKFELKKLDDLINRLSYTKIKRNTKLKMSLMVDYILLDFEERKKFAESKHEYVIEQFQYSKVNSSLLLSTKNPIKFNFKNPTKLLIWFAQLKDKITKKQYYNYTADDYYINIHKYIDADETSNPYLTKLGTLYKYLVEDFINRNNGSNTFNQLDILKMPYENHNSIVKNQLKNAVQPSSPPLINQSELRVNGHTRFKCSSYETQLIRPYTFFNNSGTSGTSGINVYNFGLSPMDPQPSGSINFSFLNDINLLINYSNISNQELIFNTITVSYNLLRIMSGYGGLGFDMI